MSNIDKEIKAQKDKLRELEKLKKFELKFRNHDTKIPNKYIKEYEKWESIEKRRREAELIYQKRLDSDREASNKSIVDAIIPKDILNTITKYLVDKKLYLNDSINYPDFKVVDINGNKSNKVIYTVEVFESSVGEQLDKITKSVMFRIDNDFKTIDIYIATGTIERGWDWEYVIRYAKVDIDDIVLKNLTGIKYDEIFTIKKDLENMLWNK